MAKKAAPKAAETKAPTPAPKAGEKAAKPKAATKGEIYTMISEKTNLTKKDVSNVFDALGELIHKELSNKKIAEPVFTIPGLIKLKVQNKPATKAKQGINPFTKAPMMIKAKPARKAIKAYPLKSLKDSV